KAQRASAPAELTLLPALIPLGGAAPAQISASANVDGYQIGLQGETDRPMLDSFLQAMGLPVLQQAPSRREPGSTDRAMRQLTNTRARVNLDISGMWSGFSAPTIAGTLRPETPQKLARRTVQ
ncbi:MAG TPA: hypothetical protein VGR50_05620, partial [Terriglobales bacterium]|nr:hypothetical protein [Terriglobales bacterium]